MKKDIHPDYNYVVFRDPSCDFSILTKSTRNSEDKIKWEDGNEYPLITVEISSGSHPFFTGKEKQYDKEGRVEKFRRKYQNAATKKQKKEEPKEETKPQEEAKAPVETENKKKKAKPKEKAAKKQKTEQKEEVIEEAKPEEVVNEELSADEEE